MIKTFLNNFWRKKSKEEVTIYKVYVKKGKIREWRVYNALGERQFYDNI